MKKKIINGILMVALLAATSTSFVSCKDNDEDVKTDLTAQLQKLNGDYQAADALLNSAIQAQLANKADNSALEAFKQAVADGYVTKAEFEPFKTKVTDDIADIYSKLSDTTNPASVASRLAALDTDVQGIQADLTTINNRLKAIEDALKNFITSVNVNATSTGILENSKLFPGINMQFLGAVYGEADKAGEFPSTDAGEYVAGHGVVLTEAEIAEAKTIDWNAKDILPKAENGKSAAGTVYFTVNPSNITLGEGVKLSLINSQDKEGYLSLGAAKESGKVLSWGTRAENGVKLFEAPAYINLDAEGVAVVDPTEMINFTAIADDLKDMINAAKGIQKNASSVKSTGKEIIKSTANIVANVVKAKVPSLPAVALKAQWEDFVGTRSVISDYSIAATAVKPLSLRFGKGLGTLPTISLDRIDNFVAKIADEIKSKFPDFTNYVVDNITINNVSQYVSINVQMNPTGTGSADVYDENGNKIGTTTVTINVPINEAFGTWVNVDLSQIEAQINKNFVNMVNNMLGEMTNLTNEIGKYTDRGTNATDKATDYLEDFINRVILKLNDDGLTRVLEPILLIQGDKGVSRFSANTVFNAGEYKVLPTTVTNEFIAPLYKKYVAVLKDGKIVKAWNLTRGDADANGFTYDFAQGNYTVVYAGLDFFGNQIAKRYNVTVK
ncbi:MAG: hypothetical protein E7102_12310 [Prevotella ruminicola]|jgi:hypothetical protein|uniref:Lipoprotein n=1 Tax=Xylanibacter ruminicola TaxID=839 RepID=A0A928BUT6_XYLRU|nr:hypothetical protein [Xylanibacter ruminicola]